MSALAVNTTHLLFAQSNVARDLLAANVATTRTYDWCTKRIPPCLVLPCCVVSVVLLALRMDHRVHLSSFEIAAPFFAAIGLLVASVAAAAVVRSVSFGLLSSWYGVSGRVNNLGNGLANVSAVRSCHPLLYCRCGVVTRC